MRTCLFQLLLAGSAAPAPGYRRVSIPGEAPTRAHAATGRARGWRPHLLVRTVLALAGALLMALGVMAFATVIGSDGLVAPAALAHGAHGAAVGASPLAGALLLPLGAAAAFVASALVGRRHF